MTLLPFLAFTFGTGLLAWFGRARPRVAVGIGLTGLVGALILAVGLPDQAETVIGGESIVGGPYLRLFAAAACVAGIGYSLVIVTAVGDPERLRVSGLPTGFLLFAGGAALTLALPGPFAALLAASGAGLAGFAVLGGQGVAGAPDPGPEEAAGAVRAASVLSVELMRVGLAAAIAIIAIAALAGQADVVAGVPFGVAIADLALALTVALRLGIIPFQSVGVRLSELFPGGGSALLLAWGPAIFALGALGASQAGVVPLGLPLSTERGLIVGVGVLSIVLGGLIALVQDDIDRAVVYSIAQDAGFVLLAFGGTDGGVWGPARSWLLVFALVKTAFLAWAATTAITFGTRSLRELRGWARRGPVLALTLVVIAIASIGVPGMASFEVRVELLGTVLSDPVRIVIIVASFSGLLLYLRLLFVGIATPSVTVLAAPDERLRRSIPAVSPGRASRSPSSGFMALNRTPISAALAMALAVFALLFAAGLLDLRSSAAMNVVPPLPPGGLGQPAGPSFRPVPTEPPASPEPPSPTPTGSTTPVPSSS